MSRCFPFPPPGYEKQPRAENLDLLAKEKRKDKKHKKEKKEKEKRERKEKKEKVRSKDKRKEKKDRKEKHKDRKKDKDVDKGRSSEDRKAEDRNEGTHNREILQKAAECNDSKFAEELGKRTRDDGAANPMVGSITSSIHRKIEHVVVSRPSLEKDRVTDKKVFPVPVGSSQRNDGSSLPVENAANFPPRRIGNISTATCMDQERSILHERFHVGINTDHSRNHGISRSIEGFPGLVNRKTEYSTAGMEKEKIAEKKLVSNSIAPAIDNRGKLCAKVAASNSASNKGKNDVLGLPLDNLPSLRCKTESMGNSIIQSRMDGMEKDRFKGSGMLPHPVTSDNSKQQQHQTFIPLRGVGQHPVTSEQRRNTTIFQPVQKDRNQKVDKKDEVTKGVEDKERAAKKNKPKDDNKHAKEEEKILEKPAMIENNKIRSFGKKDQIDILNSKPLAPHKDSSAGIRVVDETSNKRKNIKINGFIQENDARPNKIPRMVASSSQPFSSGLPVKSDIILDNKDQKINGSAKSQQLPDGNGEVSLKSPHPDSKYLEQIYTVPKMEPWLENDDVEWLFNRCDSSQQKPKPRPERQAASEESIPQVWAKALRIESADVLALPYVIPF